jgi:diaminopimelate epimerase
MMSFVMLRESHFAKLEDRLSLGQHALLLKIWEEGAGMTQGCM